MVKKQTPTDSQWLSHKSHPRSNYCCASVGPGTISDYYLHIWLISRSNWQHSSPHPARVLLLVTLDKLHKLIILFRIKIKLLILMSVELWGQSHTLKQYCFVIHILFVLLKKLVRDETPGVPQLSLYCGYQRFPNTIFYFISKIDGSFEDVIISTTFEHDLNWPIRCNDEWEF